MRDNSKIIDSRFDLIRITMKINNDSIFPDISNLKEEINSQTAQFQNHRKN
jgi:hypothetical protein